MNAFAGQRFNERMATQAKVESKQLKVLAKKTKAMSDYAQALIDMIDKQARKTFDPAKAIAAE